MHKKYDKEAIASAITNDPYLILEVRFGEEADAYRHMGFYYGDTNLLEIGTEFETKRIGKMVLVNCEEHIKRPDKIELPICPEGTLYYEMPREVRCETFEVEVFCDGIKAILSSSETIEHFKCGDVIFGFGKTDEITEILIANLTPDEIGRVNEMLEEEDAVRGKTFVFDGANWVEKDSEQ